MAFTSAQISAQANLSPSQQKATANVPVSNYISSSGSVNIPASTTPTTPTTPDTSINSSNLSSSTPVPLVAPLKTPDYSSILTKAQNNVAPIQEQTVENNATQTFKDYLGSIKAPPDLASLNAKLESDNQIQQKQQVVNGYQTQLNNITAKAQADVLSTQGQGRGIPESIIGGQQAEINKEAAIQSLPIQAQLSAAQGDLQQAQTHVDKLFQIYAQDAQNQVSYYNQQATMVYNFLDKQQQNQLDTIKQNKTFAQNTLLKTMDSQQSYAEEALKNGAMSAFNAITAVRPPTDINSPTYAQDYATYQQNLDRAVSKYGVGATPITGSSTTSNGSTIPSSLTPYLNTSSTGVQYIDASTLQGTASQKTALVNQASSLGLKVITNKNTAADLVNIQDAKSKLTTISTIMSGIAQPGWLTRSLYGVGLTKLAQMTQSDPEKAASGALESVGLDILKAISGVQGFRGNQTAVQQVTDHLPKVTDTLDTINYKISYINSLISDRENAALGTSSNEGDQIVNGVTYSKGTDGLYYPKK